MARFLRKGGIPVLLLLSWLGLGLLAGCGSAGRPAGGPDSLSGPDQEQAEILFQGLSREHSLHRHQQALDAAEVLLSTYPSFARNDEVLFLAAESAAGLGENQRALGLVDQLLLRYPSSPRAASALGQGAALAAAEGDSLRAAGYRVALFDRNPAAGTGPDGRPAAAPLFSTLTLDQLDQLSARYPDSSLQPYLGFLRVQAMVLNGLTADAEQVVQEIQGSAPDNVWTVAAGDLLRGGRGAAGLIPAGAVRPELVGVVCPLTGRFALLGNAFYDAALLALEASNAEFGTAFELKVEDSEGEPVAAALAARRLCREAGSMALLGALMSDPTATVALVADLWQVPLVSPTATNERIWELGDGIFQTNLTGQYETRLLASLATTVLLKKKFGLLYPDTPEGRGYADVFMTEVEGWGGRVVARVAFTPQSTDFKDSILAVRNERPEVIFVPASVDQMILLGPQLDFYRAGSLIMGLSNWNSEKLRERSGALLERAIFPNDLALFPELWTAEFRARWNGDNYPREATALALKSYQATRMLLSTMSTSGATTRQQLAQALRKRLASRGFETEGPGSFAGKVSMFSDQAIVPFPAGRFVEAWRLSEGAAADSTASVPPFARDGSGRP